MTGKIGRLRWFRGFVALAVGVAAVLVVSSSVLRDRAAAHTISADGRSVSFAVSCTSWGQRCAPSFSAVVSSDGVEPLGLTVTVGSACSQIGFEVGVDGVLAGTSSALSANGQYSVSAGLVSAGSHIVTVLGVGFAGGCNTGVLGSWGATLGVTGGTVTGVSTVTTDAAFVVNCLTTGQECSPVYAATVTSDGVHPVGLNFTLGPACSLVKVATAIDGIPIQVSSPLAANGVFSIPGRVLSSGSHVVTLAGTGVLGGCNAGLLGSWGGVLGVMGGLITAATTTTLGGPLDPGGRNQGCYFLAGMTFPPSGCPLMWADGVNMSVDSEGSVGHGYSVRPPKKAVTGAMFVTVMKTPVSSLAHESIFVTVQVGPPLCARGLV